MCEILLKKRVTLCSEPVVIDLLISPLCPALFDECNYYVPYLSDLILFLSLLAVVF